MATHLDQQIEQLESIVEKRLDVCQLSGRNGDATMDSDDPAACEAEEQDALEEIVLHAFRLRPVYRKVYLLCDIQGFTIDEAAGVLDLSPLAVTARLDRARREMNARLQYEHLRPNPCASSDHEAPVWYDEKAKS